MLGERLKQANKIAARRWLHYHEDSVIKGAIGFGIGLYRKSKGCECRTCSRRKQEQKRARVKALRRSSI